MSRNAIIGGSEGFKFLQIMAHTARRIAPLKTPFGPSQSIYDFTDFLYLSRHGDSGYEIAAPFVNYRANIWALKELGVGQIIAWSGPAAIAPGIQIGEILLPGDLIDETRCRSRTFFEGTGWGFVRQNPVFCPRLHRALALAIAEVGSPPRVSEVYVCTEGPRLETSAEVRKFAAAGGTLVGMTLVPEVFLARELEMCYAMVCYITNYAEGVRERPFRPGILFEGLLDEDEHALVEAAAARLPAIAIRAFSIAEESGAGPLSIPECNCQRLMERYRRNGIIGEDWHDWIRSSGR